MFLIKSLLQPFPALRINKAGHILSSLCASSQMGNAFCVYPPRAAPSPATRRHDPHRVPHRVPHHVVCPSTGLQGGRRPCLLRLPPHLQRHLPGLSPRGQRGSGHGPPSLGWPCLRAGDVGTRQRGGGSAVRLRARAQQAALLTAVTICYSLIFLCLNSALSGDFVRIVEA